jgi:hypothetical protein
MSNNAARATLATTHLEQLNVVLLEQGQRQI